MAKNDEPDIASMSPEQIMALMRDGAARRKNDADDRRRMRGKYAPPTGVCRACGGTVRAEIYFDHRGVIGGPPVAGHIARWSCESCFIVYAQCPNKPPPVETKACPKCWNGIHPGQPGECSACGCSGSIPTASTGEGGK